MKQNWNEQWDMVCRQNIYFHWLTIFVIQRQEKSVLLSAAI